MENEAGGFCAKSFFLLNGAVGSVTITQVMGRETALCVRRECRADGERKQSNGDQHAGKDLADRQPIRYHNPEYQHHDHRRILLQIPQQLRDRRRRPCGKAHASVGLSFFVLCQYPPAHSGLDIPRQGFCHQHRLGYRRHDGRAGPF